MLHVSKTVNSIDELLAATSDENVSRIIIHGSIADVPSIRLWQGQHLVGEDENASILFQPDIDGLQLTSDNEVRLLRLQTAPQRCAIYKDTSVETLGNLVINDITTIGRVQILAKDAVLGGNVSVNGLSILAADATAVQERPHAYGVHVLQGAFTLWDQQSADRSNITADLAGISLGCEHAPN